MKLTPVEVDILSHRLECPDNIAECLCDDGHDDSAVIECAERLLVTIRTTRSLPDDLSEIERAVIRDCLAGSTYAVSSGDDDLAKHERRFAKAGQSLCRKVEPIIGELVTFPTF